MKKIGATLLLLALTLGAWGETLAMTIEYDNGDPSEERDQWTARYYTDDRGRLTIVERVTKAQFDGERDKTEVTGFQWDEDGVRWNSAEGANTLLFEPDGLTRVWSTGGRTHIDPIPGGTFAWRDDYYEHRWSGTEGYSSRSLTGKDGKPRTRFTYDTKGARLNLLFDGQVSEFLLLNRGPQRLEATFYSNFLEENGWVPTGTVLLTGPGLQNSDPMIRLAHARIVSESLPIPVWPAFVF